MPRIQSKARAAAVVIAAALLASAPAAAQAPFTTNADSLSDEELDRRIEWLTTTLDDSAFYAKLWQYGWTSGYALGIGIGTAQAAVTDDSDTRVNGIVTASKAVIGTTRLLLSPHPGRLGADPIREIEGDDRAAKLAKLAAGEEQLEAVAEVDAERHRWERHVGNVALNLIGGAFIFGFGDDVDAAVSIGVGIAVGELMIFTSPKAGVKNREAYEDRFAATGTRRSWTVSLVPNGAGAAIRIDW